MNANDILQLLDQAKKLREQVPTVLTQTSPEAVEAAMAERDEHRNVLQRAMDDLSDQEMDIARLKRYVRTAKQEATTDNKKLDAHRWALIRSRPKQ